MNLDGSELQSFVKEQPAVEEKRHKREADERKREIEADERKHEKETARKIEEVDRKFIRTS